MNLDPGGSPPPTQKFKQQEIKWYLPGSRALLPTAAVPRIQAQSAVAQLLEEATATAGLAAAPVVAVIFLP